MATVTTNGDLGDAVLTMGILAQMPGGPHTYLVEPKDPDGFTATGRTEEGARRLYEVSRDLVSSQPYIAEFRLATTVDRPFWRSGGFRGAGLHRRNEPLMMAHLTHLNMTTGMGLKVDVNKPWLSVTGDPKAKGRIIINRTERYQNRRFPWARVVSHYGPLLAFVGLPHEYSKFCMEFGPVDYLPTQNLLEMAQLIRGSELFIGNQSCANAMAEGLKHRSIQETSTFIPDCIFLRPNAQHCWDGSVILPAVGDKPELKLRAHGLDIGLVSTMTTPPEGWQYPGLSPGLASFDSFVDLCLTHYTNFGKSRKQMMDDIKQHNLDRIPDFFKPATDGVTVKEAILFAKGLTRQASQAPDLSCHE